MSAPMAPSPDLGTPERLLGFKRLTVRIPAYKVAWAMNKLTPGVSWTNCTKSHMAGAFLSGKAFTEALKRATLEDLRLALVKVGALVEVPK